MECHLDGIVIVRYRFICTVLIAKPGMRVSISYIGTLLCDGIIFNENTGYSKGGEVKGGNALKFWRKVWKG